MKTKVRFLQRKGSNTGGAESGKGGVLKNYAPTQPEGTPVCT